MSLTKSLHTVTAAVNVAKLLHTVTAAVNVAKLLREQSGRASNYVSGEGSALAYDALAALGYPYASVAALEKAAKTDATVAQIIAQCGKVLA